LSEKKRCDVIKGGRRNRPLYEKCNKRKEDNDKEQGKDLLNTYALLFYLEQGTGCRVLFSPHLQLTSARLPIFPLQYASEGPDIMHEY